MMNSNTSGSGERSVQTHKGADVPKAQPQDHSPEIKEGDPNQQRPENGEEGGKNTSSRENQLPELDNKGETGADSDSDEMMDDGAGDFKGSDADRDRDGQPSI